MNRFSLRVACALAGAVVVAGCAEAPPQRELNSLSISPATATANGSPVQFTATGYWSEAPITETPMPATWGACTTGGIPTTDVTLTSTGLATCAGGAKGTYDVFAWDPQYGGTGVTCNAISACGPGCGRVSATVQLTCP